MSMTMFDVVAVTDKTLTQPERLTFPVMLLCVVFGVFELKQGETGADLPSRLHRRPKRRFKPLFKCHLLQPSH